MDVTVNKIEKKSLKTMKDLRDLMLTSMSYCCFSKLTIAGSRLKLCNITSSSAYHYFIDCLITKCYTTKTQFTCFLLHPTTKLNILVLICQHASGN